MWFSAPFAMSHNFWLFFHGLALLPRVGTWFMKMESVGQCLCYLIRGIAKRLYGDKQSTPTPHRYLGPLSGEWIYDKHERILYYLTVENFGEFLIRD